MNARAPMPPHHAGRILEADVWHAIDEIAENRHVSLPTLARSAYLDPTVFNPSKRLDRSTGKPRWPSFRTLVKLLRAVRLTMARFGKMVDQAAVVGNRMISEEYYPVVEKAIGG